MSGKKSDEQRVSSMRATAHPVRLRILSLLTGAEMSAAELARELGISHANASYHLRTLASAGLVVEAGEQKIRGGVAKRYRHPWETQDMVGPKPTREETEQYVHTMAQELIRRYASDVRPGQPAHRRRDVGHPGGLASVSGWSTRPPGSCTAGTAAAYARDGARRPDRRRLRDGSPAATEETVMTWPASLPPLRNRNFAWYFGSRFVDTLGTMRPAWRSRSRCSTSAIGDRARPGAGGAHRSRWSCSCCSAA